MLDPIYMDLQFYSVLFLILRQESMMLYKETFNLLHFKVLTLYLGNLVKFKSKPILVVLLLNVNITYI